MSQYTYKINQIAQDFAEIEMYESASALEGRDGMLIIHYNHGGKKIEFNRDSEFEGIVGKAGDTIIVPPYNDQYLSLKEIYSSETLPSIIGKWWKKIKNIQSPRI
jgi:hypothetical protein